MMLHGDLPPVDNTISLRTTPENRLESLLPEHQYWVDSGTSALALALLDAKQQFPHIKKPRAIIPGYCCPDLVAACVYAGVEPVAIDIEKNDPAYQLELLRTHIDERVVAIIAINFLGVRERLMQLRELIDNLGLQTRLIEDNAQWFPGSPEEMHFDADYTVFSFGRGKPLSLLGGGLLLAKTPLADSVVQIIKLSVSRPWLLALKMRAYNLLLIPQLYLFLNRNPFIHLGETKYSPLEAIALLDDFRRSLLAENFNLYAQRSSNLQQQYDQATASGLQQLEAINSVRCGRLLRYPLLCVDAATRDQLLESMRANGLGATAMYQLAIDQINGVGDLVTVPAPLVNANAFANRFMTLPVYSGMAVSVQKKILSLLRSA